MLKKISLVLLILVLVSAMGMAAEYQEAPELKEMVEEGELPTVEERLPDNPKVFEPLDKIGNYGGTFDLIQRGVDDWAATGHTMIETLMFRTIDNEVEPNIAVDWELSEDAKTFTFQLREGIRWSDGEPLTADDIMFWYEDVLLNEDLTPAIPSQWKPGGEVVEVNKIDKYAVEFEFAASWPGIIEFLSDPSFPAQTRIIEPAHYMKQFHIDYNSEADELAEEEGFSEWFELYEHKSEHGRQGSQEDLPVLSAWKVKEIHPDGVLLKRNPYYWKVDPEGNQLPYINNVNGTLAEDPELRALKALNGEVDYVATEDIELEKYPMLKKKEEELNYNVMLEEQVDFASAAAVFFNHAIEDEFLNELFNTPEFSQAMSLAIDREEINELAYLGRGTIRQATVSPTHPAFEEKFAKAYTDYDPERARKILDESGLEKDDQGYYLREDTGERIHLVLTVSDWLASHQKAGELIAEYWEEVGIETTMDYGESPHERAMDNSLEVGMWVMNSTRPIKMLQSPSWWTQGILWAWNWNTWFESDGDSGVEPAAWGKDYIEGWQKYPYIPDEEKRIEHAKELLEINAERLPMIGTVGFPSQPRAWNKNLGNVAEEPYLENVGNPTDRTYSFQFYFKE